MKKKDSTELNDVAILILNYNSSMLTISCIRKLRKFNIKIMIVDNCSSDSSFFNISKYTEKLNNVKCIQNKHNTGYASGNNYGIKKISQYWKEVRYVVIMNPDIEISGINVLTKMRTLLEKQKEISITSCQIIYNGIWRGFQDVGWRFPGKTECFFSGTLLGKLVLHNVNNIYTENKVNGLWMETECVPGCFFMARLHDMVAIDYFDENTFLYFEETILGKKIKNINKIEATLLDEFVYHNHQSKDKSMSDYKKRLFDRRCFFESKIYYIKKYSDLGKREMKICILFNKMDYYLKKMIFKLLNMVVGD